MSAEPTELEQIRPQRRPKREPLPVRNAPRGRYVYAWFKDGEKLPFYVGKGVGDRAWRRHKLDNRPAYCQLLRESASTFQVKIVRDNLTDEGASLLESALISFLVNNCGCILSNQGEPMRRQETGCLTIESALEAAKPMDD
jgi:hypothetical protein